MEWVCTYYTTMVKNNFDDNLMKEISLAKTEYDKFLTLTGTYTYEQLD
jgi:hypothetical protein